MLLCSSVGDCCRHISCYRCNRHDCWSLSWTLCNLGKFYCTLVFCCSEIDCWRLLGWQILCRLRCQPLRQQCRTSRRLGHSSEAGYRAPGAMVEHLSPSAVQHLAVLVVFPPISAKPPMLSLASFQRVDFSGSTDHFANSLVSSQVCHHIQLGSS